MIRITATLIPRGDESRARELGRIEIANDATSTDPSIGNYTGVLHAEYTSPAGRTGKVLNFRRQKQNVWTLVGKFLKQWNHF